MPNKNYNNYHIFVAVEFYYNKYNSNYERFDLYTYINILREREIERESCLNIHIVRHFYMYINVFTLFIMTINIL